MHMLSRHGGQCNAEERHERRGGFPKAVHDALPFFTAFPETKALNLGVRGRAPGYPIL